MMHPFSTAVSAKLNLSLSSVEAVLRLLGENATIPFIARYRKDQTGNLDEVQIAAIADEAKWQQEFSDRKAFIIKSITDQEKMTPALMAALEQATALHELEDIYLPYKPKRKTKGQAAREKGLGPLADLMLAQGNTDLEKAAEAFLNEAVSGVEDALQGARDIVAEQVNEDAGIRQKMRVLFEREAQLISRVMAGKETEGAKYKDYFEYSEPVMKVPAHRALAVLRGFMEGFLRISIEPADETALELLEDSVITGYGNETPHLKKALKDAWKRLLQPSLESEFRMAMKQRSDEEAIAVFAENLRQLLLSSPLGSKVLLAIDPGYRTGCKTVVLDAQGNLKQSTVIYVHEPNRLHESEHVVRGLVSQYGVQAVAIGDGTAGRETEKFIRGLNLGLPVFLVNEDGASVYSASEVAREEFPDADITVRGAVSIGRRLMDPLAELVKIDPKSIGVGQYQHDVNQVRLKEKLDQTVERCVNQVGVNLNTASRHLLSYVSGIGETIARNIVEYRTAHGRFRSRTQLREVPRLGEKAFEQCAGFLRIPEGENPLDNSAVHPESYEVVSRMAADMQVSVQELVGYETRVKEIDAKKYADFGALRVSDILKELAKPGLDPRAEASAFEFANIYSIDEVQPGMVLPGLVTNLTRFGAFVDIGVKQDGLVHISEMAHRFVSDPADVLKLGQQVQVKVLEVDIARKRIALSIRQAEPEPQKASQGKNRGHQERTPTAAPRPAGKQQESGNMQDALAALKSRFGSS